jgi:hypothetical protein
VNKQRFQPESLGYRNGRSIIHFRTKDVQSYEIEGLKPNSSLDNWESVRCEAGSKKHNYCTTGRGGL